MAERRKPTIHERWALLRFSVVGRLLASPPPRGELRGELERLATRTWLHPATEELTCFGVSTIERWYSADPLVMRSDQVPTGHGGESVRWDSA